ncbi:hypothetical protein [Falsiroseomonas sp. CW058]|uniref:hypothetical protein n=1 Tax=Falsiroseomonas sp. CW058 TaxID=3388664 RepID=UPI003D317F3F
MRNPDAFAPPTRKLMPGDLVRLTRDEPGPVCTAVAGEWGEVTRIHANGTLDLQLAGFSRPRGHPAPRVLGLPVRLTEPCDRRGLAKPLPTTRHWAGLDRNGRN